VLDELIDERLVEQLLLEQLLQRQLALALRHARRFSLVTKSQ
jgi:hypothetical protein